MTDIGTILTTALAVYALAMGIFLIVAPGLGVVIYLFFGRDRKAFSKTSRSTSFEGVFGQRVSAFERDVLYIMRSGSSPSIAALP